MYLGVLITMFINIIVYSEHLSYIDNIEKLNFGFKRKWQLFLSSVVYQLIKW